MPLYLWQASYTAEGTKGLMKDGGSKRRQVIGQMVEKAGGQLHGFYYCFGETDAVGIVEFPDHATALGVSMAVNAAGVVQLRSTLLLPVEEVDAATKKSVSYRPPGA
jgi:uncharacterized protein with GYD domain